MEMSKIVGCLSASHGKRGKATTLYNIVKLSLKILFSFDFKIPIYSAESSQNELARFSDIFA